MIAGYRLDVSPAALGRPLGAYVRIRPGPDRSVRYRVGRADSAGGGVSSGDGEENVLLKVQAADMDELTEVVDLFFALGQITTSIVRHFAYPSTLRPATSRGER